MQYVQHVVEPMETQYELLDYVLLGAVVKEEAVCKEAA